MYIDFHYANPEQREAIRIHCIAYVRRKCEATRKSRWMQLLRMKPYTREVEEEIIDSINKSLDGYYQKQGTACNSRR